MVVSSIGKGPQIDADAALEALRLPASGGLAPVPSLGMPAVPPARSQRAGRRARMRGAGKDTGAAADDPMKAILDAVKEDAAAKKP